MIRILIADDHALFREGLRAILSGAGERIGDSQKRRRNSPYMVCV